MNYKKIELDKWDRKEYFNIYTKDIPSTHNMTVDIDITNILNKNLKLYPSLLYIVSKVVNMYEEFRTSFNDDGDIIIFEKMNPSYTIFHKDDETFSSIWTEYSEDIYIFNERYEKDILTYGNKKGLSPKANTPDNCYNISMIPWLTFKSFSLNLEYGYKFLKPIFTFGKYTKEDNKVIIPFSTQVHHAVCDGFHLARFINKLQEEIDSL